jgi:hypothetical protein
MAGVVTRARTPRSRQRGETSVVSSRDHHVEQHFPFLESDGRRYRLKWLHT